MQAMCNSIRSHVSNTTTLTSHANKRYSKATYVWMCCRPLASTNTTVIFTTLTLNSSTLYTTENAKLASTISNLNCSELVSLELGLINSSKTLIGLILAYTDASVTKTSLLLYFMKKTLHNLDGSNDLVTVITLAHQDVNKTLVLSVLKKIMDKYFEFRQDLAATVSENGASTTSSALAEQLAKSKLGEFKLYMTQIIKFEEMQYDSNLRIYNYGAVNRSVDENDGTGSRSELITPNQLVAANEEVDEVRLLMLDNINKILNRGDKISTLVDQTDRLTSSALMFQKRSQTIKRKMWWANVKLIAIFLGLIVLLLYFFIGFECGYPMFQQCLR